MKTLCVTPYRRSQDQSPLHKNLILFIWFVRLLALRALLAYCASLGWYRRWSWRSRWNVDWQGKHTAVLGENLSQRHFCPSQNPKWPDPGLNSGRRGGKSATNRLSYGAAPGINFLISSLGNASCYVLVLYIELYLPSNTTIYQLTHSHITVHNWLYWSYNA
jgi:hypothetical protein